MGEGREPEKNPVEAEKGRGQRRTKRERRERKRGRCWPGTCENTERKMERLKKGEREKCANEWSFYSLLHLAHTWRQVMM